jgi:MFS transporter, MHS family, metabolite:H+ symporter
MGISAGTTLAAGVFALVGKLPEAALLSWGWRVPFLASMVLIVVSLCIRLRMTESPTFEKARREAKVSSRPLTDLLRTGGRTVLAGIGLRMGENGTSYIYSTFSISFMVAVVGMPKSIGPISVAVASLLAIGTLPLFGMLSDRFGRRAVYRWGAAFQAVFSIPAFALLSVGNAWLAILVISVGIAFGVDSMLGAQCAYLPELFGARYRYLGVATARETSAVIAGGIAPLICQSLLVAFHHAWLPVALYTMLLPTISFVTTFFTPETAGRDLVAEDNAVAKRQAPAPRTSAAAA